MKAVRLNWFCPRIPISGRYSLAGILFTFFFFVSIAATGCKPSTTKHNTLFDVIFITVDTLRVDHVSVFNPTSSVKTPAIDELALDGIRYSQAWSPISATGPAFCTLLTGLDPGEHGVIMNKFRGGRALNQNIPTLAHALQRTNYKTAAFVSSFTLRKPLGLDKGFHVYEAPRKGGRYTGDFTTTRAMKWLKVQKGRVFLWIHLFDPHGPLIRWNQVPAHDPRWLRNEDKIKHLPLYQRINDITDPEFYASRYAYAVAYTNNQIDRFLKFLRTINRYNSSLIIFTADHGESFTERNLWFSHGTTPFAEQLHIPLIIKLPANQKAGTIENRLAGLADVVPTVFDCLDLPDPFKTTGVSLFSEKTRNVLVGESGQCREFEVLCCHPVGPSGKLFAARSKDWTLVFEPTTTGPQWSSYHRSEDPLELKPMKQETIDENLNFAIEQARKKTAAVIQEMDTEKSRHVESEQVNETLRSLGYVE